VLFPAVAQVVRPDPRQSELPGALGELPREPLALQRLSVGSPMDEVMVGAAKRHVQ